MSAVDAQTLVNNKQYNYQVGIPPPASNPKCSTNVGCRTYHVNKFIVDDFERVMPVRPDVDTRDRMPSTELFGGPFRARGDGQLLYPEQSNDVYLPSTGINAQCDRILGETAYNRFQCVDFPLAYEYEGWGGVDSRQGHQVFRCQ
jgi:hypothetical protein